MSDIEQAAEGAAGRTPPYIAYKTWLTFLEDLKTHGLPDQIDRSVLKRFAGGIASQLIMGIKSLGLITSDNKPTARLVELVEAYGTDDFKRPLTAMLRESYPWVFRLDLTTATPSMFAEVFKTNTGAKGEDVLSKCRRFFIQAALAADIEIGKRLLAGGTGRAPNGSGTKRKPKVAKTKEESAGGVGGESKGSPSGGGGGQSAPLMEALLAKFPEFDPTWPDEIKAKWFEGFDQFMKGATSK